MLKLIEIMISIFICVQDRKTYCYSLHLFFLWLIIASIYGSFHFDCLFIIVLFLLFNAIGYCGIGDTLLLIIFAFTFSLYQLMQLLLVSSLLALMALILKKRQMIAFTPYLILSYWLLNIIQMID